MTDNALVLEGGGFRVQRVGRLGRGNCRIELQESSDRPQHAHHARVSR